MNAKTVTRIRIGERPIYFRGQLLLEDDFLAEQAYHIAARRRHNLSLYDWGVVRGLTVMRERDKVVRISPGAAIDKFGQEIFLDESTTVDLSAFAPNEKINIGLGYEETSSVEGAAEKRKDCYAALTLAKDGEVSEGLILATIVLDAQGRVTDDAIDYARTRYARLAPRSITAEQLHDDLRKGWMRLPFRPVPIILAPGDKEGQNWPPPAFRVGETRALSPDPDEAGEKDRGAGGTMAIPIPPSVKYLSRLRVAGNENKGGIDIQLFLGGWDAEKDEHIREPILKQTIPAKQPYFEEYSINRSLDPEYHTLSIWVYGKRRTAVSLIAVEFAY